MVVHAVPKGVRVELPVQAYFRINAKNMGQFERTLIIADEGSSIHYVEGCTAPSYSTESLHSAVVELISHKFVIHFLLDNHATGFPVCVVKLCRVAFFNFYDVIMIYTFLSTQLDSDVN